MKTIAKLHLPMFIRRQPDWRHVLHNLALMALLATIGLVATSLLQEAHSYFELGAYAASEARGMEQLADKLFGGAA